MKRFLCIIFLIPFFSTNRVAYAAAPDDITNNQRAWFDAVDINADGDYTNNPANNSAISQWSDKSGSTNHITATGSSQPLYRYDSLLTDRHGVDFDGVNDKLVDSDDIWTGAVDRAESFIMATTDVAQNSTAFGSTDNRYNRLSTHIPWGNGNVYFDHGLCCGSPARLYQALPISLSSGYFWHFIGEPNLQAVVQDGETLLSDTGAGIYTVSSTSTFSMAGFHTHTSNTHNGRFFEAIFYQSTLNNAQRRIINSYLSAKWSKSFSTSATYADAYVGDDPGNGHYDYFVGGIGQDNGLQNTGTSQGLTISDNSFLTSNGKFVVAGVDYLLTAPTVGVTSADVPSNYLNRSNRTWYIDTSGTGGLVDLTFDASQIGIPIDNGESYGLLYRPNTSGTFAEVATANMSAGAMTFSHLPADGIYAVGKIRHTVELTLLKTVDDSSPNIGDDITFTLTVSNAGPGHATNAAVSDVLPAGFGNLVAVSSPAGSSFLISGNTIDWTGISIAAGATASATFTAEVLAP